MDVSGAFLALDVLDKTFPQGLPTVDSYVRKRLRQAYDEWYDAVESQDALLDRIHTAWIHMVFEEALEYDNSTLVSNTGENTLSYTSPMHSGSFTPDLQLVRDGECVMFVSTHPAGTDFERVVSHDGWPASLIERTSLLCRTSGIRFGLLTDGERWTLVSATTDSSTTHVSWYSRLWFQEAETFKAFVTLLGIRRFYGPEEERLESMLNASMEYNSSVTDTLGEQVRRAVEVLVQSLDRADRDRDRELLRGVEPSELYEAGLSVMMCLVFVLSAEERGLLLLGTPAYDQFYAVSKLRTDLQHESDRHGAEVLERRHDAWSRLLAVFRAVYGGIEHEELRLPALGGSLFDPDRFAFLEGRSKGSTWRSTPAEPLPIDNRTVLLLLEALQKLERSSGALTLSYKALDVEQIGHVYEGLLDYTVRRLDDVTVGLEGSKKAKNPSIALATLESLIASGIEKAIEPLRELTQRSAKAIENALSKPVSDDLYAKILLACGGDTALADRIRPFGLLLRLDAWNEPIVYPSGSFAVVLGDERSKTGAHYTPKILTEKIVHTTLEPVVYVGVAEGAPKEEWRLRPSSELLELKICDPAMGSGAFLVQTCRWLAERLVEAWGVEETEGRFVTADGDTLESGTGTEALSTDMEERLVLARRLIAEKCLYGVDLNPMAVELAKLSIWLVTLAKGRPFGFLDHNLRAGDSLLGIDDLDKLIQFTMTPDDWRERSLFAHNIERAVNEAMDRRKRLRSIPIRDIHDVEAMKRLDSEAKEQIAAVELVADAMIGEVLRVGGSARTLDTALNALSTDVGSYLDGDVVAGEHLHAIATNSLSIDLREGELPRKPFHWALEFPEVFVERGGFDAIVGNPPFLGGSKITGFFGDSYREYLVEYLGSGVRGNADFVAYFFLRTVKILKLQGTFGLLATNTIAEGDTRDVGLSKIINEGHIYAAFPNEPWSGQAAVVTSRVHFIRGDYCNVKILDSFEVEFISAYLSSEDDKKPHTFKFNEKFSFLGSKIYGMGFIMSPEEAKLILETKPNYKTVIFPYINGDDLNSSSNQEPSRYVINFWDWSLERAKEYPELLKQVEERVKPERDKLNDNPDGRRRKANWWKYGRDSTILYHIIGRGVNFENHPSDLIYPTTPINRVLTLTQASKHMAFAFLENTLIFDQKLVIYPYTNAIYLAILQSTFHNIWARKYAASLGLNINYSPSDCFETFPFPNILPANPDLCDFTNPKVIELEELGERYDNLRSRMMVQFGIGLTKLYNVFHNPKESRLDFVELRDLHRRIDETVKSAYDWDDIDLGHDFHEVPYLPANDRVRYTISEPARLEILRRLYKLNQEQYEAEVAAGLWEKKKPKAAKATTKKKKDDDGQGSLF
jgi:hypothetical protein